MNPNTVALKVLKMYVLYPLEELRTYRMWEGDKKELRGREQWQVEAKVRVRVRGLTGVMSVVFASAPALFH